MARFLLQQWTSDTIREEAEYGGHGLVLCATPSTSRRLMELVSCDEVYVAGVVSGRVLPICRLASCRARGYAR